MIHIIAVAARNNERAIALQRSPRSFFTAVPSWHDIDGPGAWVFPPDYNMHGLKPSGLLARPYLKLVSWDTLVNDRIRDIAAVIEDRSPDTVVRRYEGLLTPATRAAHAKAIRGMLSAQPHFTVGGVRHPGIKSLGLLYEAPTIARVTITRNRAMFTLVKREALRQRIDPALALAVADVESGFDPKAVSSAGAMGLFQLMPSVVHDLNVRDPFDPRQNAAAGIALLKIFFLRYDHADKALASYRSGSGNVARHGVTQHDEEYVQRVRVKYWAYEHALADAIISEGP